LGDFNTHSKPSINSFLHFSLFISPQKQSESHRNLFGTCPQPYSLLF